MQIEILPQNFFEHYPDRLRNPEWLGCFRLICIGENVRCPQILNLPLQLSESDLDVLIAFLTRSPVLPILLLGSADAVVAALGEVLNWYFNRYQRQNDADFKSFFRHCPRIKPNPEIYRLLLNKLLEVKLD